MKVLLLVLVLGIAVAKAESRLEMDKLLFEKFARDFGRMYTTEEEKRTRFEAFQRNLRTAEALNAEPGNEATFGVTMFSDWTPAEWRRFTPPVDPSTQMRKRAEAPKGAGNYPASLDWRSVSTRVTPVRFQGYTCGSCWAFTAAAEAEGQLNTGVQLSTQQLVDCVKSCAGCSGGVYTDAWEEVGTTLGGWQAESTYPYKGVNGTCNPKPALNIYWVNATNIRWVNYPKYGFAAVLDNLASHGPLAAALNADTLQPYTSGILKNSTMCGGKMNHAVTLVGYAFSSTTNRPYYIVKNSWSTSWGLSGYFYVDYEACHISEFVCGEWP